MWRTIYKLAMVVSMLTLIVALYYASSCSGYINDDNLYPPKFSMIRLKTIKKGTELNYVAHILGPPFSKRVDEHGSGWLRYDHADNIGSWGKRIVIINSHNGKVINVYTRWNP